MILGLIDHDRGQVAEASFEALTLARRLAGRLDVPLHALVVGAEAGPIAERLPAYGVSTVHAVGHPRLTDYAPAAWAQGVVEVMQATGAHAVLAPGTEHGNEVLAHVAARAGLPMAANCIEVEPGEPYRVTRHRWGGSLLEEARLAGSPKLLTVAPHAVTAEPVRGAGTPPVLREMTVALGEAELRVRVTGRVETARGTVSLADARVVISGGRGVGSAEGFRALEALAALLGAAVGCSRVVTSLGWRPHSDQVGQTGTRVAPDLYVACGVSGAIQHMVGCKAAKHILAINTDPEAPIVSAAHSAVIGDLHEVVPAVVEEMRRRARQR